VSGKTRISAQEERVPAAPLGYCRQCNALFVYQGVKLRNTTATLKGNTIPCPNAKEKYHSAELLDGTFEFAQDSIRLIAGSDFTRRVFEQGLALIAASRKDITAVELAKEAAREVHPKLGALIDQLSGDPTKHGTAWKIGLIGAIVLLAATKCNINLDVNRLVDQIRGSPPSESQSAAPVQKEQHDAKHHARPERPKKRS
jgi:hypothetical protein